MHFIFQISLNTLSNSYLFAFVVAQCVDLDWTRNYLASLPKWRNLRATFCEGNNHCMVLLNHFSDLLQFAEHLLTFIKREICSVVFVFQNSTLLLHPLFNLFWLFQKRLQHEGISQMAFQTLWQIQEPIPLVLHRSQIYLNHVPGLFNWIVI